MSNELLEELRKILIEDFGIKLGTKELEEFAHAILNYFSLLSESTSARGSP